ncbi:hypothetical protein Nmel_017947, partial [Mimus melanotis]
MQEAQQRDYGTDLIHVLMKQMFCHPAAAFGGADQVMELFQTLLDPGNLLAKAEHKERMRDYILHWDLLRRVLLLINSKHTFLALGALHFLKKIIALKDELYTHYITQGNLLATLVQALLENGATSNLLHWAMLELFEFLRLVPSLSGRGARASEQEEQIIINAAQGGAAQTAPMSFKGSSSKKAIPWLLLTAPK